MERGNDLLVAGLVDHAIKMVRGRKRRPDWHNLGLNILSGIVIRDGRAFTAAKNKSRKQKHFAKSVHLNAPSIPSCQMAIRTNFICCPHLRMALSRLLYW